MMYILKRRGGQIQNLEVHHLLVHVQVHVLNLRKLFLDNQLFQLEQQKDGT